MRCYGRPGVASRCLRLQDEHGLDVDMVLTVLWLATRGVEVQAQSLGRLLHVAAPARQRLLEIRTLRRSVGVDRAHASGWEETYAHLKAAELAAERVQLQALEAEGSAMSGEGDPDTLARRGLRLYASLVGPASDRAAIEVLLDEVVERGLTSA